MGERQDAGRASPERPVGRARVGRAIGKARTPDRAPTDVIKLGPATPRPVFVDPSGARRRRLRRLAYAVGAAVLLALLALWLTQFGGTVRPERNAPCPTASAKAGPDGAECRR
jgi:hypothetical protein